MFAEMHMRKCLLPYKSKYLSIRQLVTCHDLRAGILRLTVQVTTQCELICVQTHNAVRSSSRKQVLVPTDSN
eukprot:jgi/Botrbrau1/7210/Bobra.0300s0035.2